MFISGSKLFVLQKESFYEVFRLVTNELAFLWCISF